MPPRPQGEVKLWARMLSSNFAEMTISASLSDLLHAAELRHVTEDFTSPPKEGVLRIFSPLKIRRLRLGLNPRTSVLKSSPVPLVHWSHKIIFTMSKISLAILTVNINFNTVTYSHTAQCKSCQPLSAVISVLRVSSCEAWRWLVYKAETCRNFSVFYEQLVCCV
jgi:hypothetical protein